MVVEALSMYNVILGRLTLNQAKAVISTYSLIIKFLTPQGARILRGDQATSQSCCVTSLCKIAVLDILNVEEMDPREENKGMSPVKELTRIILDPETPDRFLNVGSLLKPDHQA